MKFPYFRYLGFVNISKMYRQVENHGIRAPYLATKCVQRSVELFFKKYSNTVKIILNDFYINHMPIGSKNVNELHQTCKTMDRI